MTCPKCGNQNVENSKFCVKCGYAMSTVEEQNSYVQSSQSNMTNEIVQPIPNYNIGNSNINMTNETVQPVPNYNIGNSNINMANETVQPAPSYNIGNSNINMANETVQPVPSYNIENSNQNHNSNRQKTMSFDEYFSVIFSVVLKPYTAFKEKLNQFDDIKNSLVLSLIITVIATIITLLKTMFNVVRVKTYFPSGTKWVFENLKELNYIKIIGMNLFIYFVIIAAIAGIYYIGSLIVKKQTNFTRLLGISAISVVPVIICTSILSPMLSVIYPPLGMIVTIVGSIYTIIILYEMMNHEIVLDGNVKFYFNLVCMSLLALAVYYLYMKVLMSAISTNVGSLLDILGK